MKSLTKTIVPVLLVFCCFAGTDSFAFSVGEKAPDFSLKDMSGRNVSLSSFKGRVVLLNFWATWCPSCKDEMPTLNRVYKELKSSGLEVVAVSSDYSLDSLRDYLARNHFDFNILFDEKRDVTRKYGISFLPITVLIDRNGLVAEKIPGEFIWPSPDVKTKILKLLQ